MANFLKSKKYQIVLVLTILLLAVFGAYKTSLADDKSVKLNFAKVKRDNFSLFISATDRSRLRNKFLIGKRNLRGFIIRV